MATKTIAIANEKGGVGKTTITFNMGVAMARKYPNIRVVLADMDPQQHLTDLALGARKKSVNGAIYHAFKRANPVGLGSIMVELESNLHLIPGSVETPDIEVLLANDVEAFEKLREIIAETLPSDVDILILDLPPGVTSLLGHMALVAADEVVIVMHPEPASESGLEKMLKRVESVKKKQNPDLRIGKIILNSCKHRNLHTQTAANLRNAFGGMISDTVIPDIIYLAEAWGFNMSIHDYEVPEKKAMEGIAKTRRAFEKVSEEVLEALK